MTSPISSLPPELLDRIVSFLSQDKPSIGCCRLVSKAFNTISSPYLFVKVVYANRHKAITNLLHIIDHPYFRGYVTELVYDTSLYQHRLTLDLNDYASECMRAPRIFHDGDWIRRRNEDNLAIHRITQTIKESHGSCLVEPFLRDSLPADKFGSAWGPDGESEDLEEYSDCMFKQGCQKTFLDYCERYRTQECIKMQNLAPQVLIIAFSKLPKLRSIILSDWRSLVRTNESYHACARRIFGATLAPGPVWQDTTYDLNRDNSSTDPAFTDVLYALSQVPDANIESFAIGPHPFEHPSIPRDYVRWAVPDSRDIQHLSFQEIVGEYILDRSLRNLRYLYLPVSIMGLRQHDLFSGGLFQSWLYEAAQHLNHLCLHLDEVPNDRGNVGPEAADPVKRLFRQCHFPQLRMLDLRRFALSAGAFWKFLARHSSNLRTLRLLECVLKGDPKNFARCAGEYLHLESVELDATDQAGCPAYDQVERRWRQKITLQPEMSRLTDEWETEWLGGRKNCLRSRVQSQEPLGSSGGVRWYLKPMRTHDL